MPITQFFLQEPKKNVKQLLSYKNNKFLTVLI